MYKMLFAAILLSSTVALAEGPPAEGGPDPAARAEKFQERKAEILKKIEAHKACVSAASTPEALRDCRSKLGKGKHKRGDGEGGRKHRRFGGGGEDGPPPASPAE